MRRSNYNGSGESFSGQRSRNDASRAMLLQVIGEANEEKNGESKDGQNGESQKENVRLLTMLLPCAGW
jgi:hypothetical protein